MVRNSISRRIDSQLDDLIKDISKKNDINFRQASRELANIARVKIKGVKVITKRELIF